MKKVILNSIPQAYILPSYIVIFTLYSIVTTYVQGGDYCTYGYYTYLLYINKYNKYTQMTQKTLYKQTYPNLKSRHLYTILICK